MGRHPKPTDWAEDEHSTRRAWLMTESQRPADERSCSPDTSRRLCPLSFLHHENPVRRSERSCTVEDKPDLVDDARQAEQVPGI